MISSSDYGDLEWFASLSHGHYLLNWDLCHLHCFSCEMDKMISYICCSYVNESQWVYCSFRFVVLAFWPCRFVEYFDLASLFSGWIYRRNDVQDWLHLSWKFEQAYISIILNLLESCMYPNWCCLLDGHHHVSTWMLCCCDQHVI